MCLDFLFVDICGGLFWLYSHLEPISQNILD